MIHSHDLIKRRILITGANGMLGQRLVKFFLSQKNTELLQTSLEPDSCIKEVNYLSCELTKRDSVKKMIFDFVPDVIINTAAFTNVDLSESERETAWKVNVHSVEYLAETSRIIDAHLIHISTDYVFDGINGPYTENDIPKPIGYYGRTKLASENVIKLISTSYTIIRTNVLYGSVVYGRADFVRWVVANLRDGKVIRIVTDQINNPTFTDDVVGAINCIIEFEKQGIYNIGGAELLSRYDFTLRIADYFKLDKNLIIPIKTEVLKQPASRPLKSGLVNLKAETELNYKPRTIEETFYSIKKEIGL
ncbi:MAG: SDR family oxidoreductase [Ignavibacteriales bacterium]|nr:SDR family oxidoreductase [Ignavibacteriales bacterium]